MGQGYPYEAVIKGTSERITVINSQLSGDRLTCSHPTLGTFWKLERDVERIDPWYLTQEERDLVYCALLQFSDEGMTHKDACIRSDLMEQLRKQDTRDVRDQEDEDDPYVLETPQSSLIRAFHYDPYGPTLTVEFKNGSVYDYHGVEALRWEYLRQYIEGGGSAGQYYNMFIKGRYESTLMTEGQDG